MEPCAGSAEQMVDDGSDAGAHRIDAGQAKPVLRLAQIIPRSRRIECPGIDADPDAADRGVGQLRRLDVALDAELPVWPVARKSALRPRRRISFSSASAVNILPIEQSVPTVSNRFPGRFTPFPTVNSRVG